MPGRLTPFVCFYCGLPKPAEESSDEHIVPSCIGGSRNVTLTDQVCGECNAFMSKHVDLPFARDWFIEAARLLAGVKHRRKPPVMYMGQIRWDREEQAHLTVAENGLAIIEVRHDEFVPARLVVALDESKPEMIEQFRTLWKARFKGQPVINAGGWTPSAREREVIEALMALPQPYSVGGKISITAWHREVAKMALGLACQSLPGFVGSSGATRLRKFVFENDHEKREAMAIPGTIGIQDAAPRLTAMWHPGGDEHLFALLEVDGRIAFVANLFGRYENILEVDGTGQFAGILPGVSPVGGIGWVVDGAAKSTAGPTPIFELTTR